MYSFAKHLQRLPSSPDSPPASPSFPPRLRAIACELQSLKYNCTGFQYNKIHHKKTV